MHEPRSRIDPHDPISCSRWALRLGTNVRELKAAIHQFGSAADAVAYGLQQWRLTASRGQWQARSGAPQVGAAGLDGRGTIRQGMLEGSNVNVVEELVDMIETQRAYEVNSKMIQATDEMMKNATQTL